jgi:hypothetical protein
MELVISGSTGSHSFLGCSGAKGIGTCGIVYYLCFGKKQELLNV